MKRKKGHHVDQRIPNSAAAFCGRIQNCTTLHDPKEESPGTVTWMEWCAQCVYDVARFFHPSGYCHRRFHGKTAALSTAFMWNRDISFSFVKT